MFLAIPASSATLKSGSHRLPAEGLTEPTFAGRKISGNRTEGEPTMQLAPVTDKDTR